MIRRPAQSLKATQLESDKEKRIKNILILVTCREAMADRNRCALRASLATTTTKDC